MRSSIFSRISTAILSLTVLTAIVTAVTVAQRNSGRTLEAAPLAPAPLALAKTQTTAAPEFPAKAAWLNTDKPLSLRALRGKIVLLDFWTYGCINCMHILPDLKKLERKYPNELVVIGVHSAKFANEDETANIRNAMLRYNIEHPVLNDAGMRVWNAYGINAWPSFVLIDPAGNVVGQTAGEGNYDVLDRTISQVAKQFRDAGKLNTTPKKFALDAAKVANTALWYPGKVLADAASNRLYIADSNHNRIVITDLNGNVQAVAGTGEIGAKNGAFDEATFSGPQGMALRKTANGDTLFVADTNNHLIRALDLNKGTVATIAGTGKQAAWRSTGGQGTSAALASPWDLHLIGDSLYIAMAGPHQIWRMDLNSGNVGPYAGSGREARIDGDRNTAALAQPSGLATDGKKLFFADSESSSVRAVDLLGNGSAVTTLAGGGGVDSLFTFGDVDGRGGNVRLQHPLAVEYSDGKLYVADTYNHKIKVIDPSTNGITTFAGSGRGKRDGAGKAAQFYEPGGLSLADGKLYVADTNNHEIRVIDIQSGAVQTLALKNVPQPLPAEADRPIRPRGEDGTIELPLARLAPNAQGQLVLDVKLPAAHHLNKESPQRFQARVEGKGLTLAKTTVPTAEFKLPLTVEFNAGNAGERGAAIVSTSVFYCSDNKGVCLMKSLRFRAPYEIAAGGANKLTLPVEITSDGAARLATR